MLDNKRLLVLPTTMVVMVTIVVGDDVKVIGERVDIIIQHVFNKSNKNHLSFYKNDNIIFF